MQPANIFAKQRKKENRSSDKEKTRTGLIDLSVSTFLELKKNSIATFSPSHTSFLLGRRSRGLRFQMRLIYQASVSPVMGVKKLLPVEAAAVQTDITHSLNEMRSSFSRHKKQTSEDGKKERETSFYYLSSEGRKPKLKMVFQILADASRLDNEPFFHLEVSAQTNYPHTQHTHVP